MLLKIQRMDAVEKACHHPIKPVELSMSHPVAATPITPTTINSENLILTPIPMTSYCVFVKNYEIKALLPGPRLKHHCDALQRSR